MIYLFLGDDLAAKDARIIEIKSQFFKNSQEALSFDFDNLASLAGRSSPRKR